MEYYTQVKEKEKFILNYKENADSILVTYANQKTKKHSKEFEDAILNQMENQAYEIISNEQIIMTIKKYKKEVLKGFLNDTAVFAVIASAMQLTEIGRDPLLVSMGLIVDAGIIALATSAIHKSNKKLTEIEKFKIYLEEIKDNEVWFPQTHSVLKAGKLNINTLDNIPLEDLKTIRDNITKNDKEMILEKRLI